jgi:hypothetical protein
MVMKKPVIKPSANTQATSTSAAADSKNPNKEASPAGTPAAEKKKSASPSTDRPSTPTFSAEQTKIIDDVMTMGYPREEVIRACQAAFFNADRAVEYLCTGIPEGLSLNPEQGNLYNLLIITLRKLQLGMVTRRMCLKDPKVLHFLQIVHNFSNSERWFV